MLWVFKNEGCVLGLRKSNVLLTLVLFLLVLNTACSSAGIGANSAAAISPGEVTVEASPSPMLSPSPSLATPQVTESPQLEASPSPTSTPPPAQPSTVTVAIAGDVLLADSVYPRLASNGFDYPYRKVKDLLSKPDLTVVNLEFAVTTRGVKENKLWTFRAGPEVLPDLAAAGVDAVSLANNHAIDYGRVGLEDTLDQTRAAGLGIFGAGRNEQEAYAPYIVEKNGIKIALLGASYIVRSETWKASPTQPGVAETVDTKRIVAAIKQAKTQADCVIVYPHWGTENTSKVESYQRELARAYIDAGADLVVGAHPHTLQGFERYKDKWIAYSLGNFIFQTVADRPHTWETAILEATIGKGGTVDLKVHPILTVAAQPKLMDDKSAQALFKRLTSISFQVDVDENGYVKAR